MRKQYDYIAVDFDDTLVYDAFPEIGKPRPLVIQYIKEQAAAGVKIILHTCREDDEPHGRPLLTEAKEFCRQQGIPIHAVNENPFVAFGKRKVYADRYIDDRAVSTSEIEAMMLARQTANEKGR